MENAYIRKNLTKLELSVLIILILFCSITGATYAYFALSVTNTIIGGEAATVNLTLDVEKVFPTSISENTGVMVPQLSSSLSSALKKGCVDDNGNVVCQVYEVNVQNIGGTARQMVEGEILFYSDNKLTTDVSPSMPNLRWKLITSVDKSNPSNSVLGNKTDLIADANKDNIFVDDLVMDTNSNFTYYIIIWINENNEEQTIDEGNSYYASISFNSSNGTGVTSTITA